MYVYNVVIICIFFIYIIIYYTHIGIARWYIPIFLSRNNHLKYHIGAFDGYMRNYIRKHHVYLVGSNLLSPLSNEHIGIFYQTNQFINATTI